MEMRYSFAFARVSSVPSSETLFPKGNFLSLGPVSVLKVISVVLKYEIFFNQSQKIRYKMTLPTEGFNPQKHKKTQEFFDDINFSRRLKFSKYVGTLDGGQDGSTECNESTARAAMTAGIPTNASFMNTACGTLES
jgi:hypothetical protein